MNYKWTVLFLVHASNKQTREHVNALFEMLESAQSNSGIKVLVLYGGLQYSKADGTRIQVTLKEITTDKKTNKIKLSEARPGYGIIDIGDDKSMNKIFSEIRDQYPSERFLLFTWDHGSGFGIFKTDPTERSLDNSAILLNFEMDIMREDNSRSMSIPEDSIQFSIIDNHNTENDADSRDLGGEKKRTKTSMLTNDELSKIIMYDHTAKKVDLLIMMNCAMQMIETGYALKDAAEYLVAPETCIFWAGYDYISIINMICANPEIETEALGKFAIDTIKPYYENTPCKDYFNDLVVSLVMPSKSVEVKKTIDEIAGSLSNKLRDSFDDIRNIREQCEDLTEKYVSGVPYHYVDLLNCIGALSQSADKIDVDSAKHVLQQYVIHILKGDNYQNMNKENNIGQVNGCTIYFPPSSQEADADMYYDWFYKAGGQQTKFAAQSEWKDFLINYFNHDRR